MSTEYPSHYFRADEVKRSAHGGGKLAAFTIALEAWRRGLGVRFFDARPYEFEISDGQKAMRFDRALPEATTREAFRNCNNKATALRLMAQAGVPVPAGQRIDASKTEFSEVARMAQQMGYPVVLKPVLGSKGRGVFSNIPDEEHLYSYYTYIVQELKKNRIILEPHFEGEDYRVFVVGDKVAAATWRRPASVLGDGVHSVSELIAEKNEHRKKNPALSKELIVVDLEVDRYLEDQGYTYESVPEDGKRVRLRGKANLSTGGEIVDVTHLLPPEVKQAAIKAVEAVPGLVSAGVDLMIDRTPDRLAEGAKSVVIELNPRAHLGGHMFPSDGPGHNAAGALVDYFFPDSPQLDERLAGRLSFDIDDLLAPLRAGVAEQITVAALPEHRYPERHIYTLPGVQSLPRAARDRISRNSRRWTIAGSLQKRGEALELKLAGESEANQDFVALVADAVGQEPVRTGVWDGVVWKGFKITVPVKN